jgi:hypothetical protein
MRRAAALAGLLVLALSGCRSAPGPGPSSAAAGGAPLQVVHRAARSASGALTPAAAAALADAAALSAHPDSLPLDAWSEIAGGGPVAILAAPPGTDLVRAIASRLESATNGRPVTVVDLGREPDLRAPGRGAAIVVAAPSWSDGAVTNDPQALAERAIQAGRPPRLVVADLTTVQVGSEPWAADMIVAGTDPARVGLVAEFVLAARAARALPDAAAIARRRGLAPDAAGWDTAVIAD